MPSKSNSVSIHKQKIYKQKKSQYNDNMYSENVDNLFTQYIMILSQSQSLLSMFAFRICKTAPSNF